ncbi:MAG TPA: hypothetical protein VMA54_21005 [Steroidobacteraceae bacterium]|nr:hypothetical protein [Steroidobacteraceae bacterium]HUA26622.1 hypothetical protein [Steroidobacteraceae bacterium]
MRKLLAVFALLMLSACASMPMMESSMQSDFNGQRYVSGPTNIQDARFGNPEFYSDSDGPLPQFPQF